MVTNPIQNPDDLGKAIRNRRRALSLSQDEVAGVIGVNRRVVGEIENGKGTAQIRIAIEIVRVLGMDIELKIRGQ